MDITFLILLAVGTLFIAKWYFESKSSSVAGAKIKKDKAEYVYQKKPFLMTNSENDFSKILFERFSGNYRIYAQIHLSSIVDHQVKGQNWKSALSRIDRKSVDFVICDKQNNKPLCAIELDDWSHETDVAKSRDAFKESLLAMAELPLVRINDWRKTPEQEICNSIAAKLPAANV